MKALLKNGVAWLALVTGFIGAFPVSGQSGQGIVYAGTHPGQTWTALKTDYSGRWNSGLRGQGSIFGEGLLTIATLGAGFADDAGTVGRIGNMTRKLDAVLPDEVVPKTGLLDDVAPRKWYHQQLDNIPGSIDRTQSLRNQARQAFDLRNQARIDARALMSDRAKAAALDASDPIMSWQQMLKYANSKGNEGSAIYEYILESSTRSRAAVDAGLGLSR